MTRKDWLRVVAYVGVFVVGGAGLVRVETTAHRAEETAQELDAEAETRVEQSRQRCVETRRDIRRGIVETVRIAADEFTNAEEVRRIADELSPRLEVILPDSDCSTIGDDDA